jgi:hypothetical protein
MCAFVSLVNEDGTEYLQRKYGRTRDGTREETSQSVDLKTMHLFERPLL